MIVDERITGYIHSLYSGNTEILNRIEAEAKRDYVPVIKKEMQSLLKLLLAVKQPSRILEIGTAVGFSAILMSEYNPAACRITTIEKYPKRIPVAKANFKRAGKDNIDLLEGDAADLLKGLKQPYDFIFMDAAKGQYLHFLDDVMALLPEGGILVSDNVLQEGDITESRYGVCRRNRTIHNRMREYLYQLTHLEDLVTSVLSVGDGVTISTKKRSSIDE